jgi:hypothetical protein
MFELMSAGFAPVAIVLSFIAGNRNAQESLGAMA